MPLLAAEQVRIRTTRRHAGNAAGMIHFFATVLHLAPERGKIRPPPQSPDHRALFASHVADHPTFSSAAPAAASGQQPGAVRRRRRPPGGGGRCAAPPLERHPLGTGVNFAADPRAAALLRFDNLTLGYNRHPAVHHLQGEIANGSLLAVAGPNGAGKSTLLKAIAGELRPLQGRIERGGLDRRQIAYLTQQATLDQSFPIVVHDFVAMGLWREIGAFLGLGRERRHRVHEAIERVGLLGLEKRPIGALSGGQLQRALFARLMLQDAPLVLLDEPYGAIDAASVRDLATLVRQWHDEGRTVIAVLHDLAHVRQEYPETLLLARELVARGETASVLTTANLQRARRLAEGHGDGTGAAICQVDRDAP